MGAILAAILADGGAILAADLYATLCGILMAILTGWRKIYSGRWRLVKGAKAETYCVETDCVETGILLHQNYTIT